MWLSGNVIGRGMIKTWGKRPTHLEYRLILEDFPNQLKATQAEIWSECRPEAKFEH
jgi:hypothetical protein